MQVYTSDDHAAQAITLSVARSISSLDHLAYRASSSAFAVHEQTLIRRRDLWTSCTFARICSHSGTFVSRASC